MIGVILAAGKGSRMGGVCKPLEAVGYLSIVERIVRSMGRSGIRRAVVVQRGYKIRDRLGRFLFDVELEYTQQGKISGSGGAFLSARAMTGDESVLLVLGDIVYTGEDMHRLGDLLDTCEIVCGVKPCADSAKVSESYGITTDFHPVEKPKDLTGLQPLLGLGMYAMRPSVYELMMVKNGRCDLMRSLEPHSVCTRYMTGKYWNVNTKDDLSHVREALCGVSSS